MQRNIGIIDRIVEQSVKDGTFQSSEECAQAMHAWLTSTSHIRFSERPAADDPKGEQHPIAIEDDAYGLTGIHRSEGIRLQYDILRERDA